MAVEKLKRYKSPGTDQIPADMIQAGSSTMHCEILKLINSVWIKKELPEQWKAKSLYLLIRRDIKQIVVIIKVCHCYELRSEFYPTLFSKNLLHMQMKLFGISRMDAGQNYNRYR